MSNGSWSGCPDTRGRPFLNARDQASYRRSLPDGFKSGARHGDTEALAGDIEPGEASPKEALARPWQVLPLAARTPAALAQTSQKLAEYLRNHRGASLADLASALQGGAAVLDQRRALVARDTADALAVLGGSDPQRLLEGHAAGSARPVAFLFPGPGSQHIGMAAGLYASEPVFRRWFDRCCDLLVPHLGLDLRTLIFDQPDKRPRTTGFDERRRANDEGFFPQTPEVSDVRPPSVVLGAGDVRPPSFVLRSRARARRLEQTEYAQPALFAVEYALARLWMDWGVTPAALLGHSVGEYVAAALAGVFTLEDALALVADRARMIQALPSGAMLAVALPEAELLPLLEPDLALAAVNGPQSCVIAGPAESVAALSVLLQGRGVHCRRLHASHAFHSQMMEPVIEPLAARVAQVALRAPRVPVVSSLTGTWLTDRQATDPRYWAEQARQPVRFADGVATLLQDGDRVLLEVGPGTALSTSARRCAPAAISIASLGHPTDERPADMLALIALGQLWVSGAAVDWQRVTAEPAPVFRPLAPGSYAFRARDWLGHEQPWRDGDDLAAAVE